MVVFAISPPPTLICEQKLNKINLFENIGLEGNHIQKTRYVLNKQNVKMFPEFLIPQPTETIYSEVRKD